MARYLLHAQSHKYSQARMFQTIAATMVLGLMFYRFLNRNKNMVDILNDLPLELKTVIKRKYRELVKDENKKKLLDLQTRKFMKNILVFRKSDIVLPSIHLTDWLAESSYCCAINNQYKQFTFSFHTCCENGITSSRFIYRVEKNGNIIHRVSEWIDRNIPDWNLIPEPFHPIFHMMFDEKYDHLDPTYKSAWRYAKPVVHKAEF
jgi:hypothetical protein